MFFLFSKPRTSLWDPALALYIYWHQLAPRLLRVLSPVIFRICTVCVSECRLLANLDVTPWQSRLWWTCHASKVSECRRGSQTAAEGFVNRRSREGSGEQTPLSFPLTHTPELTGFQHNDQGSGERRWRTGSPDKALVSLPIQRPRSHISRLWGGDRTIRQTTWLLPLAKCDSAERKTRSRGREKEPSLTLVRHSASHNAVSIQINTLVSQTAKSDFQCRYEKGPFLSWNVCPLLCVYPHRTKAERLLARVYNRCR